LDALRELGRDADTIAIDDLAGIDEFHAPGDRRPSPWPNWPASPGTEVIDVGAGLGGPARVLAARLSARVTADEPTARFRNCAPRRTSSTRSETRGTPTSTHQSRLPERT
jgi:hypothetical protein